MSSKCMRQAVSLFFAFISCRIFQASPPKWQSSFLRLSSCPQLRLWVIDRLICCLSKQTRSLRIETTSWTNNYFSSESTTDQFLAANACNYKPLVFTRSPWPFETKHDMGFNHMYWIYLATGFEEYKLEWERRSLLREQFQLAESNCSTSIEANTTGNELVSGASATSITICLPHLQEDA